MYAFPWQLSFLFQAYLATVPINTVAYMWNTGRKVIFVKIINALEVVAAPQEPVMQAADPEQVPVDMMGPGDYDET